MDGTRKEETVRKLQGNLVWLNYEENDGVEIIVSPTYAETLTESEHISDLMKEKEMNILQIYALQTGCSSDRKRHSKKL
jgi:hypothetical protein